MAEGRIQIMNMKTYQVDGVVVEKRVSGDMFDPRSGLIDDSPGGFVEAGKLHSEDSCG